MKILFHIEPLLFHGRPLHYAALFDFFVRLADSLREGAALDARFVSNPALIQRAGERHSIPADQLYGISDAKLRDVTGLSAMETLRALYKGGNPALLENLASVYRNVLGDFQPEVVITISPSPYWKTVFPDAVVFHVDGGLFSRDPLPHVFFLDSDGIFNTSAVSRYADVLRELAASPRDRAFVDLVRAEFRHRLLVGSPFHQLERDLRSRFRRVLLLPLQFAGEFGFDLHCDYDRQGSYLLDVLERVSPDTAVVVSEHPTALWLGDIIDPDTREFVSRQYPNAVFAPGIREGVQHAGQTLLHHADAVACVSSSLGMQAVFFEKPLLALGSSHLTHYATWRSVAEFNGATPAPRDLAGAVAWMLRCYYMPTKLCMDGRRFARHVAALAEAAGEQGLDRYSAIASDEDLLLALLTGSSIKAA